MEKNKILDLHINIFTDLKDICETGELDLPVIETNRSHFKVEGNKFSFYQASLIMTIQNRLSDALNKNSKFVVVNFKDTDIGWIAYCLDRKVSSATLLFLIPCWFSDDKWKVHDIDAYPVKDVVVDHLESLKSAIDSYDQNKEYIDGEVLINAKNLYISLQRIYSLGLYQLYFYYVVFFLGHEDFKTQARPHNYEYLHSAWANVIEQTTFLREKLSEAAEKVKYIKSSEKSKEQAEDVAGELLIRFNNKKDRLPDNVRIIWEKENKKLSYINSQSPDYAKIIEFLELILDLPFNKYSANNISIQDLQTNLDVSHYGLEKAKMAIVEHIALQRFSNNTYGEVICLIGPPGTGKTSLANVVANTLDRRFMKIALGGMADESEFRGHRRTYVGSEPGRLIKGYATAGTFDPVIVFDEVDKLSAFRGSPADALLEILDPEQSAHFVDRYLSFPVDISKTMFICTANYVDQIPDPLKDRMSIIDLEGYSYDEQIKITKDYIIPKYAKKYNMVENVNIADDLISRICVQKKSGMRDAERAIREIYKKSAYTLLKNDLKLLDLDANNCMEKIRYEFLNKTIKYQPGYR